MKTGIKIALISAAVVLMAASCMKPEPFPIEPVIKYKDFIQHGSDSASLIFTFTDGDGDLGSTSNDSVSKAIFLTYFEKRNDQWQEIQLPLAFSYNIPVLTPTGRNKAIEGEIEVKLLYYYDPFSDFEAYRYNIYIVDRAGHKSNVIETPPLSRTQ